MNQILDTGDERNNKENNYKRPKERKERKIKGEKKVLEIKTIVIFFAISIIILGICLIIGSTYAKRKINDTVESQMSPSVKINRNADDTVEISVSHIRGIQKVEYKWNKEESKIIQVNNQKQFNEKIALIGGKNTLTVTVTEENGKSVTYQKEFVVGNIPEISLEAIENGIKVKVKSQTKIDYIEYQWDDGEKQKIPVGDKKYEGTINAISGKHTLKIIAVDIDSIASEKSQVVVGSTAPKINVKLGKRDNKIYFVIDIEDEDRLAKVDIVLNNGETRSITVNDKTYHEEIELVEGENRLIIVAENANKITTTSKKLYDTRK